MSGALGSRVRNVESFSAGILCFRVHPKPEALHRCRFSATGFKIPGCRVLGLLAYGVFP